MRTESLCISVLRVASEPRVKLASCKSALYSGVKVCPCRAQVLCGIFFFFFFFFVILTQNKCRTALRHTLLSESDTEAHFYCVTLTQ